MCVCEKGKNNFVSLNPETQSYSGIELGLCKNMLRTRYFNDEGYMITQDIIMIKYCPLCGKELKSK